MGVETLGYIFQMLYNVGADMHYKVCTNVVN